MSDNTLILLALSLAVLTLLGLVRIATHVMRKRALTKIVNSYSGADAAKLADGLRNSIQNIEPLRKAPAPGPRPPRDTRTERDGD